MQIVVINKKSVNIFLFLLNVCTTDAGPLQEPQPI